MHIRIIVLSGFLLLNSAVSYAYEKEICRNIIVNTYRRTSADAYQNCGNNPTFNICLIDMIELGYEPSTGHTNCTSNAAKNRCIVSKVVDGKHPAAAYDSCP